jgi:hypothetical protein
MVASLARAFRGSNPAPKQASTASTVTHASASKHHHSASAFATATKRIVSVFDSSSRSSWIPGSGSSLAMESTSNLAAVPDDVNDDNRPLLAGAGVPASVSETPPYMSPTGGGGSPGRGSGGSDSGKKIRSITPKILALKAMFEHRSSLGSGSHSAVPSSPEQVDREGARPLAPQRNRPQARDGDTTSVHSSVAQSSSTAASTTDHYGATACPPRDVRLSTDAAAYPEPPTPTARQPNMLTRIASRAELALKRKASSRSGVTSAVLVVGAEPAAVRTWREKVDTLAAWAARCRDEGRVTELDCKVLCTATDVAAPAAVSRERERGGAVTPLPVIHSEETLQGGGCLSPEEDLAECVGLSGSGAHLAGYFALVLNEVSLSLLKGSPG